MPVVLLVSVVLVAAGGIEESGDEFVGEEVVFSCVVCMSMTCFAGRCSVCERWSQRIPPKTKMATTTGVPTAQMSRGLLLFISGLWRPIAFMQEPSESMASVATAQKLMHMT